MTTHTEIRTQVAEILSERTTEQLVEMAQMIDRKETLQVEERMTLAWLLDAIEVRHPETSATMDAWIDAEPDGRTYTEVLVAALEEVAA